MKKLGQKKATVFIALLLFLASANGYFQGRSSATMLGLWLTLFTTLLFILIAGTIIGTIFRQKN